MDSILNSIKKLLGVAEEYTNFDPDIIMHINSVFMILNQIGVGPPEGFMITDKTAIWDDYVPKMLDMASVKTYMYLKVRLMFDPPLSSIVTESMKQIAEELQWRLQTSAETKDKATPI